MKKLYGNWLEKPNLAGSAGVHFTTEQEAKISHRYGVTTKDIVIPLGVNIPERLPPFGQTKKALNLPEDVPLLLFMSRIDPKKGLNFLLAATENLVNQGIKFHLVLAGANPQDPVYEQQIKQQIANSILAPHTTITGFVTGEMKLGLLQDADVFVLPSYYENFGIAVAEAMAVGTPVVISEGVYIWPDVQQAAAGWVTTLETDKLTAVLKEAIASPDMRQEKGKNAQELVFRKYGWSAIAQQMIQVYDDLT